MMHIREAQEKDLASLVHMLSDDPLGKTREDFRLPLPTRYVAAFREIDQDKNQELIVVENNRGHIIGSMQLSFIRYLTYQGGMRAQVEGVRVHREERGKKIGEQMIKWAIERSKEKKCHLIQLTSDKKRPVAIKFYQNLGFQASHEGMKLHLE